jgi:hypothetical protein
MKGAYTLRQIIFLYSSQIVFGSNRILGPKRLSITTKASSLRTDLA